MRTQKNNITPLDNECTPAEMKLLNFIREHGAKVLVESLRDIHNIALYNSNIMLHDKEKCELLDIKLLADELEKVG